MAKRINMELRVQDKGTKEVKKFSDKTRSTLKTLAGVAGIGLVTTGFTKLIKSTIDYADQLQKLNLRLGTNVAEMDKLRKIAEKSGVEFNTLTMAMQRMVRRLQDAANTGGPVADVIKDMGLNLDELLKLSPDQQFKIIAKRIADIEDPSKRVSTAFKLWDSEGVRVLQMTKDLDEALSTTGTTMDEEFAKKAAEFKDILTDFRQTMQDLAVKVIPPLNKGLKTFIELWKEITWGPPSDLKALNAEIGKMEAMLERAEKRAKKYEDQSIIKKIFTFDIHKDLPIEDIKARLEELYKERERLSTKFPTFEFSTGKGDPSPVLKKEKKVRDELTESLKKQSKAEEKVNNQREREREAALALEPFIEMEALAREELDKRLRESLERTEAKKQELARKDAERKEAFKRAMEEEKMIVESTSQFFADRFSDAFSDFITGTKNMADSFKNMVSSMLSDLTRMMANKAFMQLITAFAKTDTGGGIVGTIGGILGLQSGGTAKSGTPYVVGESGPELFIPNRTGTVLPNGMGLSNNVAININVQSSQGTMSDAAQATKLGRLIGQQVKSEIRNVIANETRYGGILNRSMSGRLS